MSNPTYFPNYSIKHHHLLTSIQIIDIMQDPIMQSILQQAQNEPAALQEHMKNPGIRVKIQKLVAAGVIRVGR